MSNDAQKVQEVILGIHVLWGAPVLIVVILALLYQQVGWATFVGLAVMLIYTPLSSESLGWAGSGWSVGWELICSTLDHFDARLPNSTPPPIAPRPQPWSARSSSGSAAR
jgi:hypothetical protein